MHFNGLTWREVTEYYHMEADNKCIFFLDRVDSNIYFMYKHLDNSESLDSKEHEARDDVPVHYPNRDKDTI
jgi:hypothetical protein